MHMRSILLPALNVYVPDILIHVCHKALYTRVCSICSNVGKTLRECGQCLLFSNST